MMLLFVMMCGVGCPHTLVVVSATFILPNWRCRMKILLLLGHFVTTEGPRRLIPSQDVDDFGNNCRKAEKQDKFPVNPRKTHVGILLFWTNGLSHRIAGKNRTVQVYIRGEGRNMRYDTHIEPPTPKYFFQFIDGGTASRQMNNKILPFHFRMR